MTVVIVVFVAGVIAAAAISQHPYAGSRVTDVQVSNDGRRLTITFAGCESSAARTHTSQTPQRVVVTVESRGEPSERCRSLTQVELGEALDGRVVVDTTTNAEFEAYPEWPGRTGLSSDPYFLGSAG